MASQSLAESTLLTRLRRRNTVFLPQSESTIQLFRDTEVQVKPQFKLTDWLLLVGWSFEGLGSRFPTGVVEHEEIHATWYGSVPKAP